MRGRTESGFSADCGVPAEAQQTDTGGSARPLRNAARRRFCRPLTAHQPFRNRFSLSKPLSQPPVVETPPSAHVPSSRPPGAMRASKEDGWAPHVASGHPPSLDPKSRFPVPSLGPCRPALRADLHRPAPLRRRGR